MQQELRKKTQRMKDLQTEVTRLKAIKSRKATKLSERYARELEELRSDNSKGLEKQKAFVDKLQEAVSTLNAKARNLSDKLESNGQTLSSRVAKAKEDGVREIRRAQSQWETDEKTVFDKLAHSKR
jgi:phage host-nuclease inhibitor protein Gam